jgi:hypothetical protein
MRILSSICEYFSPKKGPFYSSTTVRGKTEVFFRNKLGNTYKISILDNTKMNVDAIINGQNQKIKLSEEQAKKVQDLIPNSIFDFVPFGGTLSFGGTQPFGGTEPFGAKEPDVTNGRKDVSSGECPTVKSKVLGEVLNRPFDQRINELSSIINGFMNVS